MRVHARAVDGPAARFRPAIVERREPGRRDIVIDIAYAGICHSDIDHVRSTRGHTVYPLVPGHEIAGVVAAVGADVGKFSIGDHAGVGNMVDSCRVCASCRDGFEQYCSGARVMTYGSVDRDGRRTQGGYSERIVVDEAFAVKIPRAIPLERAAPLFCAGITLYSPLMHWRAGPGRRVGIVGLGGLGHVGVQIARALGAQVTVFDLAAAKCEDALRLGASEFRVATDTQAFASLAESLDLVISTVPANIDFDAYLGLLGRDGTLVNLSVPTRPFSFAPYSLLRNRRSIAGTLSGGIAETQAMIDFCAAHGIGAEVEVIAADAIDAAFTRLEAGDVRYRFVIDVATMAG